MVQSWGREYDAKVALPWGHSALCYFSMGGGCYGPVLGRTHEAEVTSSRVSFGYEALQGHTT